MLAGGASFRAVAKKFTLSHHALRRHWLTHVSEERRANLIMGPVEREMLASKVAEESSSVIDHFRAIRSGLYQLFNAALEAGDRQTGALIAGRLDQVNNSIARITGELIRSPLVTHATVIHNNLNLRQSQDFEAFKEKLIAVLEHHPAALSDVIIAFERLSQEPAPLPALEHHDRTAFTSQPI